MGVLFRYDDKEDVVKPAKSGLWRYDMSESEPENQDSASETPSFI